MGVRRTTIELDQSLTDRALRATGETLRATVERGLHLVVAESDSDAQRQVEALARYRASALDGIDVDVLMSGEAWR